MNITNKIMENGNIVGYMIEDGRFSLPMCKDALYDEVYITGLISEGYKYYSREANDIEDKDGNSISNLPAIELSTLGDSTAWNASLDVALSSAMSDAEASKYYSFKEESVVHFRTESTYTINTREELIHYLEGLKRALYSVGYSTDNRPLNSFVNPDALFTIDEVEKNPDIKAYLDIMVKRHTFRNYTAYTNLCKWLCDKGVLKSTNPSSAEFLSAYYAWGPEGIKDKCTSQELKLSVDGSFAYAGDPLSSRNKEENTAANRDSVYALFDDHENLCYLKLKQDTRPITDVLDFGRARVNISSNNVLFALRRGEATGYKYNVVPGTVLRSKSTYLSDVTDRVYFTLISESGYNYQYKASLNKLRLGLNHSQSSKNAYYNDRNFMYQSIVDSFRIPMWKINNQQDYYLWNLIVSKVANIIKQRTRIAPASSTMEFLTGDGLSPIAAVGYMASRTTPSDYGRDAKYELLRADIGLKDAMNYFFREIPDNVLNAFMIKAEELDNGIETFLELADVDDLRDRRELMRQGVLVPGMEGYDDSYILGYETMSERDKVTMHPRYEDSIDYYTQLKFAYDCLNGNTSVDYFGDGLVEDNTMMSYEDICDVILTVCYAEFNANYTDMVNYIMTLENSTLFNVSDWLPERSSALRGYRVDFSQFRAKRAGEDTTYWAYCSKVFREISNAPLEKQRPYLMELIVLNRAIKADNVVRQLMHAVVKEALDKLEFSEAPFKTDGDLYDWNLKRCAYASIDMVAANLFFYVLSGRVKEAPVDDKYIIPFKLWDSKEVNIEITTEIYNFIRSVNPETHKKYITVYDFCKYEFNQYSKTGTFSICLVNASVDPWHVTPKKGYAIRSYSLLPNYYEAEALNKANGEEFYDLAIQSKGIIGQKIQGTFYPTPLKRVPTSAFDPYIDDSEMKIIRDTCAMAQSVDDLSAYYTDGVQECIFEYVKRWIFEKKKARAMGKKLISIPLKQDIAYHNLSYMLCEEVPETESVFGGAEVNERQAQTLAVMVPLRPIEDGEVYTELTTNKLKIRRFTVGDIATSLAESADILSGDYEPILPIVVSGNYINFKAEEAVRLLVPAMTVNDFNDLANNGICKKLADDKFYIKALNGNYIVEV